MSQKLIQLKYRLGLKTKFRIAQVTREYSKFYIEYKMFGIWWRWSENPYSLVETEKELEQIERFLYKKFEPTVYNISKNWRIVSVLNYDGDIEYICQFRHKIFFWKQTELSKSFTTVARALRHIRDHITTSESIIPTVTYHYK